jgi:hypothetical protein
MGFASGRFDNAKTSELKPENKARWRVTIAG